MKGMRAEAKLMVLAPSTSCTSPAGLMTVVTANGVSARSQCEGAAVLERAPEAHKKPRLLEAPPQDLTILGRRPPDRRSHFGVQGCGCGKRRTADNEAEQECTDSRQGPSLQYDCAARA